MKAIGSTLAFRPLRVFPFLLLTCPVACLASAQAWAQPTPSSAADADLPGRADLLFRQGQELIDAGKPADACPKLEESQRLDPKLGRLLNVAYCHELVGRTASAWSEYNEAAALAAQKGQPDRVDFARQHAAALVERLSLVQLDFSAASIGGAGSPSASVVSVAVDGKPLSREQWSMPFPVDPGIRTFTFGAPGKKTHDQTAAIAPGRGTGRVIVDRLEPEVEAPGPEVTAPGPAPAVTPAAAAVEASGPSAHRPLAYVAGGVGVAGLLVGAGFLLHALAQKNDAAPYCPADKCDPHGASIIDGARTSAWIATVGVGVGVGGAAAAVWLFLTSAPSPPGTVPATNTGVRVEPLIGAGSGGLALRGAW